MSSEHTEHRGPLGFKAQASVHDVLRKRGELIHLVRTQRMQAIGRSQSDETENKIEKNQADVPAERHEPGMSPTESMRRQQHRHPPPPSSAEGFL
mmetsp:Transcript_14167/g.31955  ORF Transcript_14167/g.31955 Transcript_14167/m.31955 type:complete len:95 (-) Transcript_14167:113-397(-)